MVSDFYLPFMSSGLACEFLASSQIKINRPSQELPVNQAKVLEKTQGKDHRLVTLTTIQPTDSFCCTCSVSAQTIILNQLSAIKNGEFVVHCWINDPSSQSCPLFAGIWVNSTLTLGVATWHALANVTITNVTQAGTSKALGLGVLRLS